MTPEKTKQLFEEFPTLYRGKDKPISESLMAFGFECGDGWFNLIRDLSAKIMSAEGGDKVEVMQVKEKFGGLRYYVDNTTDEIDVIIRHFENEAELTCEDCGSVGKIKSYKGWLTCLCDNCEGER